MSRPVFLSAEWRHVVLVNYEVEPSLLLPFLPWGTELDSFAGKTYVSLVAFMFLRTRLLGVVPAVGHRDFEEVNLRFYVRRGDRRGVVFIKELVPKPLLAFIARRFYAENYVAVPMSHEVREGSSYRYVFGADALRVGSTGRLMSASEESLERFFTEHYWGYTRVAAGVTNEYEVKHPVWNLFEVSDFEMRCDAGALYGAPFGRVFAGAPASVFVADGSPVTVHWPSRLRGP